MSPLIDFQRIFQHAPACFMLLDRQLRFVAANDAYLRVTGSSLEQLFGRYVFEVFPQTPEGEDNTRQLRDSFERVLRTGKPDVVALIVYRVPQETPAGTVVTERFWSATHTPILDDHGGVALILQHTEDVTEVHQLRTRDDETTPQAARVLQRAQHAQAQIRALDVERRFLLQLFEQAPVFTCFLRGREHVYELTNAAYLQLVGHRELLGQRVKDALPEVEGQGFIQLLDNVFNSGEPFIGRGVKLALQPKPGAPSSERYLDFIYQPIVEADGKVSGIFVLGSDVTEQYGSAAARNQLATIVEQSSDFIGQTDATGKMIFVNEAGTALLGIDRSRVEELDPFTLFAEEDWPFIRETITPALQQQGRWRGEFRMRHLVSSEVIPVDYNVFLIRDAQGNVTGVASVTRDLRERRQAEQELAFLAHSIPAQVWTADPAGALTYVNQRVTEYFGVSADSMLKNGWLDFLAPEDVPGIIEKWTRSLQTGADYEVEFRLRRADREMRWHSGRARALRDDQGRITKWYGTNNDIDDQKRSNEERDRLIAALGASNQELDRFAYVASHDLKTPLRGIGNIAQWLADDLADVLTPQTREHLELMRDRVARMDALIGGVLRYSRAHKADEHVQEVAVADLIDVVVDLLAPPSEVKVVVGPRMPVLQTTYVALQQVFLNLIGNAIKHANRTDAVVEVTVREDEAFYTFFVADNGPGISAEHHERIWGLFQTLEHVGHGEGIGLSVVKRLVQLNGGTVGVAARPGAGGSVFSFSWPKHRAPPAVPTAR